MNTRHSNRKTPYHCSQAASDLKQNILKKKISKKGNSVWTHNLTSQQHPGVNYYYDNSGRITDTNHSNYVAKISQNQRLIISHFLSNKLLLITLITE